MALDYSQASLLGLPLEIRLLIYEYLMTPDTFDYGDPIYPTPQHPEHFFEDIEAFRVILIGSLANGHGMREQLARRIMGKPWTLAQICRQIKEETAPMLKAISFDNIHFSFYGFNGDDMREWTRRVGPELVSKMRHWAVDGMSWCDAWHHWRSIDWESQLGSSCIELHKGPHREHMQCYRAAAVNLAFPWNQSSEGEHRCFLFKKRQVRDQRASFPFNVRRHYAEEGVHSSFDDTCAATFDERLKEALGSFVVEAESDRAAGGQSEIPLQGRTFTPTATAEGLVAMAQAVSGQEDFDDHRLLERFVLQAECGEMKKVKAGLNGLGLEE